MHIVSVPSSFKWNPEILPSSCRTLSHVWHLNFWCGTKKSWYRCCSGTLCQRESSEFGYVAGYLHVVVVELVVVVVELLVVAEENGSYQW